jgi:hypothetical protein
MMVNRTEELLQLLIEKVDRILSLLETRPISSRRRAFEPRATKQKSSPLTAEEIDRYQKEFEILYTKWDAGEELEAEKALNALKADELRRFADANNLNVTSKMAKGKVLQLIAGRFRERRQLMRIHSSRRSGTE